MGVLNLNRKALSGETFNVTMNALVERAVPDEQDNIRQYLGASGIGSECLRQIQFGWMAKSKHPARLLRIFARGHWAEDLTRKTLIQARFVFSEDEERLRFEAADGSFKGHADGVIVSGPEVPELSYPCVFEHKCLGHKGFQAIERDGLESAYPHYAIQIWLYQAYLNLTNPALVAIMDADTCELLFFPLPYNPQRAQLWSDRAAEIIRTTRAGEMLPRFTSNPNDFRCTRFCGFYERCWGRKPEAKRRADWERHVAS